MAKVFGIHTLELKPGANAKDFEDFVTREILPLYDKVPGQTAYLLRGDRGERSGKYAVLIELESAERRDHIYPLTGDGWGVAEEVQELVGDIKPLWDRFYTYAEEFPDPHFTDYVQVSN